METLERRYGILVNDAEWRLLYRSVVSRRDNIEEVTGKKPEDLVQLAKDLSKIKQKGYIKTNENMVTEEDARQRVCKNCE